MNLSNLLAILWGITIVATSLTLLFRPKFLTNLLRGAQKKSAMLFWGFVNLIIGVVLVFIHNVWTLDWRVVITLLGWLTLLKGLDTLLLPRKMKHRWAKTKPQQWRALLILLLTIGLMLTYLGFVAK